MTESSKKIPEFEVQATSGKTIDFSKLKGKNIVLYFYPKDNTPGCTLEGKDFRDNMEQFEKSDTVIFGVSRDTLPSHEKFREKYGFPFDLISDADEELCDLFGVLKNTKMFGKTIFGVERSTFLFDKDGQLIQEWRKVKAKGHVENILKAIKQLV